MQQNEIRILSTRPLTTLLTGEAKAAGITVDELSFIETEPIRSIEVQQEIEHAFLQSAVVVFTSMNAVEAVAGEQHGQHPDWSIYCIGNTTRQRVQEYFGETSITGTASSAAELAEQIAQEAGTDEVIFFCGDQRRDELPDILRSNAIEVNEVRVYETIGVPHKIDRFYHGILFFSPSAVQSFFTHNKADARTVLFAIGNTTAKEVRKFAQNNIIVGDEPGKENLVKKMIEYFS